MSEFNEQTPPNVPYKGDDQPNNQGNQGGQFSQFNANASNLNDFDKPAKPDNSMVLAIVGSVLALCTSCFGLITGIIAIVYATQVDSKYNMGDYYGAEAAAKNAKTLAIVTLVLDALALIVGVIYVAIVGVASLGL